MEKELNNKNVYEFIDEQISSLLTKGIKNRNAKVSIANVVEMLLIIESLIPEVVIDGDEMVKYFSKKSHEA